MPRRELKVSPEIPHAVVEGLELLRSRLEVPISSLVTCSPRRSIFGKTLLVFRGTPTGP